MKRIVIPAFPVAALLLIAAPLFAEDAAPAEQAVRAAGDTAVWKYFAAAIAVGISCIAGGLAVGQIGSAAMGAMSENPELSGKALPYAGLAEGICLWGFLVALLILIL
ncbi:MAG: ATP synthase subunit C [Spirochaetaceae bacterium]|jgi:V/A-type H+-transporting ATPase subunit K|nr:ATP synthase subunit C [Spirochaetaceae bacterium]